MDKVRQYSLPVVVTLLFLIGLVPFNYRPDWVMKGIPFHQLVYFAFGCWCLIISLITAKTERIFPRFIIWNLIFFCLLVISSLISSYDRQEALQSSLGMLLRGMAPGFLVYWLVALDKKEEVMTQSLIAFGVVVSISALYEVITGRFFIFQRFDIVIVPSYGIASGAIGQPLPLSVLLNMVFPLAFDNASRKKNFQSIFSVIVIVTALLLTYRRSVLAVLVLTVLAFGIIKRPSMKMIGIILMAIILGGLTCWKIQHVRNQFIQRMNYDDKYNRMQLHHRFMAGKISWQMALERPWFGIGTRQYLHAYQNYERYEGAATTPDNQYLRFLSENGFLGLGFFLIGLIAVLFRLKLGQDQVFGVGFFLSGLSLALGLAVNDALYWAPIQYMTWILLGIGLGLVDRDNFAIYSNSNSSRRKEISS